MPTSIAHVFGGLAAAEATPLRGRWSNLRTFAFCALVANLPDADFLPGLLTGSPVEYHREASHAPVVALLFALACGAVAAWRNRAGGGLSAGAGGAAGASSPAGADIAAGADSGRDDRATSFRRWFWVALLVYGSHLLLDAFATGPASRVGIPLLWPLSSERWYIQLPLPGPLQALLDLDLNKTGPEGFFPAIFSRHGLAVFLGHALLFAPLPVIARTLAILHQRIVGKATPARVARPRIRPLEPEPDATD